MHYTTTCGVVIPLFNVHKYYLAKAMAVACNILLLNKQFDIGIE